MRRSAMRLSPAATGSVCELPDASTAGSSSDYVVWTGTTLEAHEAQLLKIFGPRGEGGK